METLELPSIEKVKRKEKILRRVDIYICFLQKYTWIQYNKKKCLVKHIWKSLLEILSDAYTSKCNKPSCYSWKLWIKILVDNCTCLILFCYAY